jgi:hypothetical protein
MADLTYGKILLISFLAVAALFAFSFLFFASGFKGAYFAELPLEKNSEFQLRPGDSLAYSLHYMNESGTAAFAFGRKQIPGGNFTRPAYANCTLAAILGDNVSTCIYPDGRDGEGNQSLEQPFFFFAPWMLALSENFSWSSEMRNSITNEPIEAFLIEAAGSGVVFGRDAYIVDVRQAGALGNTSSKLWIDKRNRILLKEEGQNYTVEIIRAPFPLQPQGE